MTNPVLEAIRTRRMVRALTDAPVPREQVELILKAVRWAPSAATGGSIAMSPSKIP